MSRIGCRPDSLRPYLTALARRGYVDIADRYSGRVLIRSLRLVRDTGPRAPSWSVHTDAWRDWNSAPGMGRDELRGLIRATGLSDTQWLTSVGRHPNEATRLRQMMHGQRPVPDRIAKLARGPD